MIGVFAMAGITSGTLLACIPGRLGVTPERGELVGGLMLVVGFILIGVGLSPLLIPPSAA